MTLDKIINYYNLSGAKLLIFAYISEKEEVKYSLRDFSKTLGFSVNSMRKYLEELEKERLIVVEESGSNKIPNLYRVRKSKLRKGI